MIVKVNMNTARIEEPINIDVYGSVGYAIRQLGAKGQEVKLKVETKYFPGSSSYERETGYKVKDVYFLYYENKRHKTTDIKLCVEGLRKVFGTVPRRIYVKIM